MASRFTELYRLPQNLYCAEAPVVVAAGVLLKDNESGSVLAQLKFKSIFPTSIKALKLKLSAFDVSGAEVQGVDDYQYLDLATKRGQFFGDDKAVLLPDAVTRSFAIAGISVIFADGKVWELSDGTALAAIPEQKTLVSTLGRKELAEQYQREVNSRAVNAPCEHLDLWRCACGEINRYETCTKCGAQKEKAFSAMDTSALQVGLDAHLEKERQKAEEKARLEAEQAELKAKKAAELKAKGKKAAKIGAVAVIVVAIVVAAAVTTVKVIIPKRNARVELEERYNSAIALIEKGDYQQAAREFTQLNGYKDSVEKVSELYDLLYGETYNSAVALMEDGKTAEAMFVFGSIPPEYKDAKELALELWGNYDSQRIAAGIYQTAGLKMDGTVAAAGSSMEDVSNWSGIISVELGGTFKVGLKANGTVVAVGSYGTSGWEDITAIAAGDSHLVGLKADGTVVASGGNADGQCDVSEWSDIVAIAAGTYHTVGLKSDGTVVVAGSNEQGQSDVSKWSDIVAIAAGSTYTVGLKADGSVVAEGWNGQGQCNVSEWSDIVAVAAGYLHTVGLKADGTVVATGENGDGQCDVSDWSDIVAVDAGSYHTVGLKADGTVVAVGSNKQGQCDVSDWSNIAVPAFVD